MCLSIIMCLMKGLWCALVLLLCEGSCPSFALPSFFSSLLPQLPSSSSSSSSSRSSPASLLLSLVTPTAPSAPKPPLLPHPPAPKVLPPSPSSSSSPPSAVSITLPDGRVVSVPSSVLRQVASLSPQQQHDLEALHVRPGGGRLPVITAGVEEGEDTSQILKENFHALVRRAVDSQRTEWRLPVNEIVNATLEGRTPLSCHVVRVCLCAV